MKETRQAWSELEVYQRFEQIIVIIISLLIAVVIALSTWHLVAKLFVIARADLIDPARTETFQEIFDMIIVVLIALEFNYTVLGIVERGHSIVQVKAVVLIALLAVLRKFIVLDSNKIEPMVLFALAAAVVALGALYWTMRDADRGRKS